MTARQHGFSLRPARAEDEAFLLELRKSTMTAHLQRAGEPVDDDAHRARLLHCYDAAQIISVDGMPVGLLKAHRSETGWCVVQLQIAPAHQGRGLGAHALQTVLQAAQRDALPVSLKVLKGNPARRLYERLGFTVVSETEKEFHMKRPPEASTENRAE